MPTEAVAIGDHVTFRDLQGVTREGRIVATEKVSRHDRQGRRPGQWVTVKIAGSLFEAVEIPASNIGAILASAAG